MAVDNETLAFQLDGLARFYTRPSTIAVLCDELAADLREGRLRESTRSAGGALLAELDRDATAFRMFRDAFGRLGADIAAT